MIQERDWQKWRRQQSNILAETIAFSDLVFRTTKKGIEGSRVYGATLLAQSIDCARAIHLCVNKELPSPAFSFSRAQYEGALRGHIIIHEIELEELNDFLLLIGLWQRDGQLRKGPPKIEISETGWRIVLSKKSMTGALFNTILRNFLRDRSATTWGCSMTSHIQE